MPRQPTIQSSKPGTPLSKSMSLPSGLPSTSRSSASPPSGDMKFLTPVDCATESGIWKLFSFIACSVASRRPNANASFSLANRVMAVIWPGTSISPPTALSNADDATRAG